MALEKKKINELPVCIDICDDWFYDDGTVDDLEHEDGRVSETTCKKGTRNAIVLCMDELHRDRDVLIKCGKDVKVIISNRYDCIPREFKYCEFAGFGDLALIYKFPSKKAHKKFIETAIKINGNYLDCTSYEDYVRLINS